MRLPVVVGVDGSPSALGALDWGADMAQRCQLPLRIVHASLWQRYEGHRATQTPQDPAARVRSEAVLALAAERAGRRAPEVKVTTDLAADEAVPALLCAGQSAAAVVVGSRGRGELTALLLGSVGLGIAARALCPVVVVRGRTHSSRAGTGRVTVGVAERGSGDPRARAAASAAVAFALREARLRGCELEAVHAWRRAPAEIAAAQGHPAPGEAAADPGRRAGEVLGEALRTVDSALPPVPVVHRAVENSARRALLDASARSDLLVVGARRRQGHFGLQLGLVNHAVLHHAQCPVAVVPQH